MARIGRNKVIYKGTFVSNQSLPISFSVFELLKKGEILQIPTVNPMTEKQAWSAFRDVIHGLEYRKNYLHK